MKLQEQVETINIERRRQLVRFLTSELSQSLPHGFRVEAERLLRSVDVVMARINVEVDAFESDFAAFWADVQDQPGS